MLFAKIAFFLFDIEVTFDQIATYRLITLSHYLFHLSI